MSRPLALLFPGQGAQEVGMGRDLLAEDEFTLSLLAAASKTAGKDLQTLCLKGPDRILAETRFLQPALTCVCLGLLNRLYLSGLSAAATAGHSVGELSALVASGAARAEDMATLAAIRGRLMSDAATLRPGGMAAVSGGTLEEVEAAIDAFKPEDGILVIGAVNAPTQVTISGDRNLVETFCKAVQKPGIRVTALRVSGAWHSPHMASVVRPFEQQFAPIALSFPKIPMILNRDGLEVTDLNMVRIDIPHRLIRPVRWDLVMQRLFDLGIRDFVEVGPGKVLRGLVRLNDASPDIVVHNVSDLRSVDRALVELAHI